MVFLTETGKKRGRHKKDCDCERCKSKRTPNIEIKEEKCPENTI